MPGLYPALGPVDCDDVSLGIAVLAVELVVGSLVRSTTSPPVEPHPNARAPFSAQLYVLQSEDADPELKCR